MLAGAVTRRAVVNLPCECDLVSVVFTVLLVLAEFVLALVGGVLERIIGVLERMIVSRSILMTVVVFSVLAACFCVGVLLFRISGPEVLKLP